MVFVGSVRVWWRGWSVWELRIVCGERGGVGGIGYSVWDYCVGAWELHVVCVI